MDFNEYQTLTNQTAIYPKEAGIAYTMLGLGGEIGELQSKYSNLLRGPTAVLLSIAGKSGEIQNKYKKILRDKNGIMDNETKVWLAEELEKLIVESEELETHIQWNEEINVNRSSKNATIDQETKNNLASELGDIMWYVSQLATELGFSLGELVRKNIDKLMSRKERNQLQGSGDTR